MHELLQPVVVDEIIGDRDVIVRALTHDSRAAGPGTCFVCIPGAQFDGHAFAPDAVAAGARSLIVERILPQLPVTQARVTSVRRAVGPIAARFYGDVSASIPVLGVTGTNGKTTTTFMLAAILRAHGRTPAIIGTAGIHRGEAVEPTLRTTPEATDLQALLARLAGEGSDAVAMEVSSHALDLHRVDGTHFAAVGFTNLTQDHLDYHETMEQYYRAKTRLFTALFTDRAAIHLGDPRAEDLIARAEAAGVEVAGCAIAPESGGGPPGRAVLWASAVTARAGGSSFRLHERDGGDTEVVLPLAGRFNVENALVAATMARLVGVALPTVGQGLGATRAIPGRMERIDAGQDFTVIVDYAHTPDALTKVVAAAHEQAGPGRVLLVFGCGGERDHDKREPMGRAAGRADLVWLTNDNARGEDPNAIAADVSRGLRAVSAPYTLELDRRVAIGAALAAAGPTDVVVIAGKGHESGQVIGDEVHPFDDRHVARALLEESGR